MDYLSTLATSIWQYGIMFLLVLTLVVFIHELGHFLVARWCGVAVKAFSIGFGPEIYGFYDKHGTRWRFAWIPLGGYVKFIDDDNPASARASAQRPMSAEERSGAFHSKSVGVRAAVVVAGPVANFLLAIALYAGLNAVVGVRVLPAYVDAVVANSPAARAGFMPGDKIVAIGDDKIERFDDLQRIVGSNAGQELTFTVERGGETLKLNATPNADEQKDALGRTFRRGLIGIQRSVSPDKISTKAVSIPEAIVLGVQETYTNITQALGGIGDIITRKQSAEQMGGPIMMAEVTAKVAELGIDPMLRWIAFISANIGFLNLLPIPILDGGHLMFYAYEAVRGKPAGERLQQMGFQVGLALLMMLMVFVNFNDIMNVWRRLTGTG
ncbi:MAG TPA: RIP metalloprotease RseP [Hyphomicrobium sp.]|jgi:regulator of sigma E protease|uniref:RIP metalloprotease RseP n=1 Tax=Hyphomicrobium sp. TaxID=82 RepID=UPI002CC82776|nr:RIP metalloprotease RseP [Hyphomicrobium sp.]HXE00320.1 RIP metalloprotease RseP [Hyphomicrobium sp.]